MLSLNEYIAKSSSKNTNITIDTKGVFFFIYIDSIYISSEKDAESFKNKNISETVGVIIKEIEDKKE